MDGRGTGGRRFRRRPWRHRRRRAIDGQRARRQVDRHRAAISDRASQDLAGQRILKMALDHPLQRSRAVNRIITGLAQPAARRRLQPRRRLRPKQSPPRRPIAATVCDNRHLVDRRPVS